MVQPLKTTVPVYNNKEKANTHAERRNLDLQEINIGLI